MTVSPLIHQSRGIELNCKYPRWGNWLDPGCGKTLMFLWAMQQIPIKTLVLAPKSILRSAWQNDATKIGMEMCVIAGNGKAKRTRIIQSKWNFAVTNFDTFRIHREDFWKAGVRRIVIDESARLKNFKSQISKCAVWFSDNVESVWLGCGVPAPNSPVEYFPQVRCIDKAKSGLSFYGFENRYTTPVRKRVWINGQAREVTVSHSQTPEQKAALTAMLNTCSWTLRREDCLDLPKEQDIIIPVEMKDEASVYATVENALRIEVGSETWNVNGSAVLTKLRQITGGVVKAEGAPYVVGTSKLAALDDLLDSLGNEPVVVFAEFTAEIDSIVELARKRGETVATIDGRSSSFAGQTAESFQAGHIRVLVCQPQAAGHGITLVRSCYMVFFSMGFSYELYTQARGRIQRIGQTRPPIYYHLLAVDSIDYAAYRVCKRKGAASDEIRAALVGKSTANAVE